MRGWHQDRNACYDPSCRRQHITDPLHFRPTTNQMKVMRYIEWSVENRGFPPSVREIRDHLGVRSPGTVHKYLTKLAEGGWITKESNQARSIRLSDVGKQLLRSTR